jgi:hypothetical protein
MATAAPEFRNQDEERLADAYGVCLILINGVVNRGRRVPAT